MTKRKILIFIAALWLIPLLSRAAASAPLTQEEIEAMLERGGVEKISSSTLPEELKRRIDQAADKAAEELPQAAEIIASSASRIIATSADKLLASTSDKIKSNLENMQAKVKAEMKKTLMGRISGFFAGLWQSLASLIKSFFAGKGAG